MSTTPLGVGERNSLRLLLRERDPGDAIAAYYALHHPAAKSRIWVHRVEGNRPDGFLVRAQTGQDLFRPFVVIRAKTAGDASELLLAAFSPGQPFLLSLAGESGSWPLSIRPDGPAMRLAVLKLDPARFQPVVNIFVRSSKSPDGLPFFEIRQGERLVASAGVNWMSPEYAEIYSYVDPEVRQRGFGKSVVAALCNHLLEMRRGVLYAVERNNAPSQELARGLGFEDTGAEEVIVRGTISDPSADVPHIEFRA